MDKDTIEDIIKKGGAILAGTSATAAVVISRLDIYLHEYGHKVASEALFTGPEGSITIHSFFGVPKENGIIELGFYEREVTGLTSLGTQLGYDLSRAMVSSAGPGAGIAVSLGWYAVGSAFDEKRPYTALAMKTAGYWYFFMSPLGDALVAMDSGSDVYKLAKKLDVSPTVPAAAISLSLPILALAIYLKKARKRAKAKNSVDCLDSLEHKISS